MFEPINTLERYRDYDAHPIVLSVRPDKLMDERACESLMEDLRRCAPNGWEMIIATPDSNAGLPDEKGLYIFVWAPYFSLESRASADAPMTSSALRSVLYVGKAGDGTSGTIRSRFRKEYRRHVKNNTRIHWDEPVLAPGRKELLDRYLNLWELEFWFAAINDESMIGYLEGRLIRLLDPPINQRQKVRRATFGKSVVAF